MNVYIAGNLVFWVALLVAVPALTMRLLAEERRSGTIEGLLTVPITEAEVVVAKWLAGVVMFWALLLPFAIYLPVLRHYGNFPFDLGPVAALAIGLTTIGMMFVAIGVFFSALTQTPGRRGDRHVRGPVRPDRGRRTWPTPRRPEPGGLGRRRPVRGDPARRPPPSAPGALISDSRPCTCPWRPS